MDEQLFLYDFMKENGEWFTDSDNSVIEWAQRGTSMDRQRKKTNNDNNCIKNFTNEKYERAMSMSGESEIRLAEMAFGCNNPAQQL